VSRYIQLLLVPAVLLAPSVPALAQDDDAVLQAAQPDFTLLALPTTLRLPQFKGAFRVTHRFARPLGEGDFGDLAADFFGLDRGAIVGLEYRFGIVRNGQVGVHRSANGKTVEFFGQYALARQDRTLPVDLTAWASIDATNNFKDSYSPALGAVLARQFADTAAVYVLPIWVNNSNPQPGAIVDDNSTFQVGIGGRVRVRPTVYLVGEIAPRAAGFKPGVMHAAFGVEKRAGGHMFQLTFSNSWATTMGQIARGGPGDDNWFLGFNLSRKFY
jgi:hypothetical protein